MINWLLKLLLTRQYRKHNIKILSIKKVMHIDNIYLLKIKVL